ncbi:hypothetical protein [Christiangramia sp.]|uniref:hypothetical protein n=1 Tax=Christiangramia sp. TaxID=1931228 RepID=UPI00260C0A95|nr:hypothetical protein [Christiangramia sp.]
MPNHIFPIILKKIAEKTHQLYSRHAALVSASLYNTNKPQTRNYKPGTAITQNI